MDKSLMRALIGLVGVIVLVVGCIPPPENPVLIGLADYHTHQFGYLGFGGHILSHSIDPAEPCLPVPEFDKATLRIKDLVRAGFFDKAAEQAKEGKCYPTVPNLASQRMDTKNLHEAWRHGLRLIVMFTVNSEFLCRVAELADPCPSDREAIELQVQAAKDLEAKIDAESGGQGLGWYRIVYTPDQARDVIEAGKLAVVLGVEASNAFGGCRFEPRGAVPAIRGGDPETTWALNCGYSQPGLEAMQTQEALALFEHYWKLGIRHFYPIHNINGTAGGTALGIPILHADDNPSRHTPGGLLNQQPQINNLLREMRPPIASWDCSSGFDFDGGRCNALGLTETGRALIKMMASYGAVMDIDHMSLKAKRELLSDEGLLGGVYPFVSSHSGIQALNHGDKKNEGQLTDADIAAMIRAGGAFGPILPPVNAPNEQDTYPPDTTVARHVCGGTSESYVQAYRYVVDKLRGQKAPDGTYPGVKLLNGQKAFVGVGLGTDFNAPVPVVAAPRFVRDGPVTGSTDLDPIKLVSEAVAGSIIGPPLTTAGGLCYPASPEEMDRVREPHVTYPFEAYLEPLVKIYKSTTPWGGQTTPYDINFDGMVHIGMLPDFVEELRAMKLSEADLQPLWRGAEAYVRAWEASEAWKGNFNTEDDRGITQVCQLLRAELLTRRLDERFQDIAPLLERLKRRGCHGFPPGGAVTRTWLYLSDQVLGNPQEKIEAPAIVASETTKFAFFLANRGNRPVTVSGIRIEDDPEGFLKPDLVAPVTIGVKDIDGFPPVEGFVLEYRPTRSGPFAATVVILSDEPGLPELLLKLVGEVGMPPPSGKAEILITELDFGPVARGASRTLPVAIRNVGDADLSLLDVTLAAEQPTGQFLIPPVMPLDISPGATVQYWVTYAPTVESAATAKAILRTSTAAGGAHTITLRGSSGAPHIALDRSPLDFGAIAPGATKQMTVTIRNTGNLELTVSGAGWSSGAAGSFVFDPVSYPLQIAPGGRADIGVAFTAPPTGG